MKGERRRVWNYWGEGGLRETDLILCTMEAILIILQLPLPSHIVVYVL